MFKAGWITGWYVKKQGGPPCFPALGRPLMYMYVYVSLHVCTYTCILCVLN